MTAVESANPTTIPVRIPQREPHDVLVGVGILDELPRHIEWLDLSKEILIISSPTIFGLYGQQLTSTLEAGGCDSVDHVLFPDGEEHKTLKTFEFLLGRVKELDEQIAGKPLIINLGGGVVGDVGTYVAASYGRGQLDYIQLPTTLLGDVDCGIGGKCGVNLDNGKNLVGTFYQPRLVLAELSFLKSLPIREMRSGLAEVIKYGVVFDSAFFAYLEDEIGRVLSCDLEVIAHVVECSFRHKIAVVEQDERDTNGIRAKLNFGHTVGHALESATECRSYAHGEAVAIGMVCACEIAERLGFSDHSVTERVESICRKVGLPTTMDADLDSVLRFMQLDKKFHGGTNAFVLPSEIGHADLHKSIDVDVIREVVRGRIRP